MKKLTARIKVEINPEAPLVFYFGEKFFPESDGWNSQQFLCNYPEQMESSSFLPGFQHHMMELVITSISDLLFKSSDTEIPLFAYFKTLEESSSVQRNLHLKKSKLSTLPKDII